MAPYGRASRFGVPLLTILALCAARPSGDLAAQAAQASSRTLTTAAEREAFLAEARVVRDRPVGKGVTNTLRVTLTDGVVTHDASVQTIDEYKAIFQGTQGTEVNFRDSWRYNVAAYRIDRLLEMGMIPATVERAHKGQTGSFTWWVDDVLMDEQEHFHKKRPTPNLGDWNQQMWTTRLFDQLIANVDRNLGNLLIDKAWDVWLIDHSRAFRLNATPKTPANLTRVDRALLDRLRGMDAEGVRRAVGDYLTAEEIAALLKRRDFIVSHFERGGGALVFNRRPRCC